MTIGAAFAVAIGPSLLGVSTPQARFPDSWPYAYTAVSILGVAVVGLVFAVVGLFLSTERQFYNYACIGTGLGILLLGSSFLAMEKVEVTQDAVVVRGWWGLSVNQFKYAEMRQIRAVHHQQRGWRRTRRWETLHYEMRDGSVGTLSGSTRRSRLFFWAKTHLLQSAAKRGVEIKREHDNGN